MVIHPSPLHRYMDPKDPDILFPFGFGLSYTSFRVTLTTGPITLDSNTPTDSKTLTFNVTNTGSVRGAETVLVYFQPKNATNPGGADLLPLQRQLFGFAKADLAPGETTSLSVPVTTKGLARANANGDLVTIPDEYNIILSTGTVDSELQTSVTLTGTGMVLESLPPGL